MSAQAAWLLGRSRAEGGGGWAEGAGEFFLVFFPFSVFYFSKAFYKRAFVHKK